MKRKRDLGPAALNLEQADTSRPPKRKRNVVHEAPTSEEVNTARHLSQLLAFDQDLRKSRHGLQSFKDLLDGIVDENGETDGNKLQIVTQYLEMTKPRDVEDQLPVYLADIMETWSMASQMNNENVMSAVVVVLALLLKLLSGHVDHLPTALGISRTILQKRQVELLARNLSADKGKDFIISPTLRLVREIVCLDGGVLAVATFRARNYTFKSLARNMGLRFIGEGIEDPKRPSVRTNAVRVLLSILKYVHVEAKRDLLFQKDVVTALMRGLKDDPPYLIFEILNTLRSSVVLDQKLSKDAKIRLLNSQSLTRIASLYTYHREQSQQETSQSVEQAAHEFLLAACTTSSAGILRAETGYYPEGIDPDVLLSSEAGDSIDFGLESIPWMDGFSEGVPVRNTLLSDFIQALRPWSSLKQNELLVAIFAACPELVANYFANKKSFSFDPKLSATWIGYSTLIFNTIRLGIPPFFGHHKKYARIPPPTAVLLGNVLPLPLEAKSLSRCLIQKSKLISFFATRLLVIALEKLSTVLDLHRKAGGIGDPLWANASRRLIDEFCKRTPSIKEIINAYRSISDGDLLQRVAASRLLVLYHEVIPQVALAAKFDFSPLLSAAIQRFEISNEHGEERTMRLMELENLFAMAKHSPGMKWFARGKEAPTSPFITLLKLHIENVNGLSTAGLVKIINFVAEEHELVTRQSQQSGLTPLLTALRNCQNTGPEVWAFLDSCSERCARAPIKYQEMICEIIVEKPKSEEADSEGTPLSPLLMTIVEQLPFLVASAKDKATLPSLALLLSDYLGNSYSAGINKKLLDTVLKKLVVGFGNSKAQKHLSIPEKMETTEEIAVDGESSSVHKDKLRSDDETTRIDQEQLEEMLSVPIKASKDNSALVKWASKTSEELVEDGYAAAVIWLLSSEHPSVRKEAFTSIVKMAAKIKESTYDEKEQVWLLLSELAETVRRNDGATIPSTILGFSCRALDILRSPTHCLYPKLNTFLTRGPVWDLDKIPLAQDILLEGPTEDGAYYTELSWLLSYFLESLRTSEDAGLFHKRKVFERIFALDCNPYMGPNLRNQILRIVYRVTTIDGGSDTLITRFGVVSWLETQRANNVGDNGVYRALVARLWKTCDQKRIAAWSRDSVKVLAEEV